MEISDEIKKYLMIFGALIAIVYFIYEAGSNNFLVMLGLMTLEKMQNLI